MLLLKYLLLAGGVAMLAAAAAVVLYDLSRMLRRPEAPAPHTPPEPGAEPTPPPPQLSEGLFPAPVRWSLVAHLAATSLLPLLTGASLVIVPSGHAGVRVSEISGTLPGALQPGVNLVKPLVERVVLFDVREQVFNTTPEKPDEKRPAKEGFQVHAREGLAVGLGVTVRYRLDAQRLHHIHANLPSPVERELVPTVVATTFRRIVPNYTVREIFSVKREEIAAQAAKAITEKLGADGIVVNEVMIRDIHLPAEYAQGLEKLLLKDQENEGLVYETEIKQKQVRIAELQAEAAKARQVKQAEADAQSRVLQAKGESDAMKFLLPLKEKQIEQSRLEAQARKEATLMNAEAAARAKVIDSEAELQRRNLLAEAEANRIRVTAVADAERMQSEAAVLRANPLLINKILAEKLSDKLQIMMVPTDGRFFFNDMLRGALPAAMSGETGGTEAPAVPTSAARTQSRR